MHSRLHCIHAVKCRKRQWRHTLSACAAGDFEELCGRLRQLEAEAGCAPLVCVVDEDAGDPSWPAEDVLSDEGIPSDLDSPTPPAPGKREEWEIL